MVTNIDWLGVAGAGRPADDSGQRKNVMKRYFVQGPHGTWRDTLRAICIDFEPGHDTHTGRLMFRDGRAVPHITYTTVTIDTSVRAGEWREASQDEIDRLTGKGDTPKTTVEVVW
jgi:hypothetical protein